MTGPRDTARPDPDDPGFPHGTLRGYNQLGCRRACCRAAVAGARAAWQLRQLRGETGANDRVDAAEALALLRAWGGTYSAKQISRFTGLTARYIAQILSGSHTPTRMAAKTVRAITTAQPPAGEDLYVPQELYWQRLFSLAAMGYPVTWIARRLGLGHGVMPGVYGTADSHPRSRVRVATFARLDVLYQQIGHIPAENHAGPPIGSRHIAAAKKAAARRGYHPPACYDDNGTLIPEAVRHEPLEDRKADRDRLAQARLAVLRLSLAGVPPLAIQDAIGGTRWTTQALVQRTRAEAGLRFAQGAGIPRGVVLAGDCVDRAAEIRAVLAAHDADSEADPYETCKELGLMTGPQYAHIDVLASRAAGEIAA